MSETTLKRRGRTGWFVHVDGTRVGYVEPQVSLDLDTAGLVRRWVAFRVTGAGEWEEIGARRLRHEAVSLLAPAGRESR